MTEYIGPWEKIAMLEERVDRLEAFRDLIDEAHVRHLKTGEYIPLGIAAQDALRWYSKVERDSE